MSNEAYPRSRTDTLVGPGMRIEGRVAFRGVLRVFGEIDGDVVCADDAAGVLVVEPAGRVAGCVAAPNLVVKGKLVGEMRSAGSIEIATGGSAEGDASYRTLDVRRGGRLVGRLQPTATPAGGEPLPAPAGGAPEGTADRSARAEALLPAVAATPPRRMLRRRHLAAAGIVLAVLALLWSRRTAVDEAPSMSPAAGPAATVAAPQAGPDTEKPAAPQAVTDTTPPPATVPEPPPPRPAPDADRVIAIQGSNPAKAAHLVYVVTRDPAVVYRKRRGDAGEGTRIEIERNRNLGLPVARNEILRFTDGRAVEAFYQGRKLPPQVVEGGAWIGFTPATGE